MQKNKGKYIHCTRFKDIQNWSVQYNGSLEFGFTDKYPLVKIGSFLAQSKDTITILEDQYYRQITLRINNGGIVPRDNGRLVIGSEIGTKRQTRIHSGQFILSKIDARNGAFGVVPDYLEGAVVTNDFPVFDVDKTKIYPQFLVLISATPQFISFSRKCSSGTTNRKRLDITAFLEQTIPLPNLEKQELLLNQYNNTIEYSNNSIQKATDKLAEINMEVLSDLGVEELSFNDGSTRLIKSVKFSGVSRWDCYNNLKSSFSESPYHTLFLGDVIKGHPMYGASYSTVPFNNRVRYIRITDIKEDGSLIDTKVSANGYNSKYDLKNNDFLIARSGNTVGKTFLYQDYYGPAIFAGYLIKFEINEQIIDPRYLLVFTKTRLFKEWIMRNMRISAQPNINIQQYLYSPIIVPDMETQHYIIERWENAISVINGFYSDAQTAKEQAQLRFIEDMFYSR